MSSSLTICPAPVSTRALSSSTNSFWILSGFGGRSTRLRRMSWPDALSVNLAIRDPRSSIPPQKASLVASSSSRRSPVSCSVSLQNVVTRMMFFKASSPQSSRNILRLRSADPSTLGWLIPCRYMMPASLFADSYWSRNQVEMSCSTSVSERKVSLKPGLRVVSLLELLY
jgi:hypothetical protein